MTIDEKSRASDDQPASKGTGGEEDLAKEGVQYAKDGARQAYQAASKETQRMGEFVRDQADNMVDRQKTGLARGIAEVARHIRNTSDGLSEQPNIEDLVVRAADQVDAAAHAIDRKSPAELYNDAEDICRRYPVTVATCAVVLGALVSRSLKNPPQNPPRYGPGRQS